MKFQWKNTSTLHYYYTNSTEITVKAKKFCFKNEENIKLQQIKILMLDSWLELKSFTNVSRWVIGIVDNKFSRLPVQKADTILLLTITFILKQILIVLTDNTLILYH